MEAEVSSYVAHVAHDQGQGPPIENGLTECIPATDSVSEEERERATQLGGVFYFSLNKRD